MARILFVTPYYPPEVGAPQTRISETAIRLVKRGHQVTVLTTLPNYPTGRVPAAYQNGQRRRETLNGVSVIRVWSYIQPNRGFLGRVLSQLSFGLFAAVLGFRAVGRPDLMFVESPPLFDAFSARLLATWKRSPFIFVVSDIWPESAVQLGMLHNKMLIWLAERLEWSTYQRAHAVWAVTAGIRQAIVERGLPGAKVFLLPNGVDTTKFRPLPMQSAREQLGWDARFTVLYAGTMGLAHGLQTALGAAEALQRDHPDIRLVLAGDGAAKPELIEEARRRGLQNVTFMDAQPHERMPSLIAAADACLVSLRKLPLFEGALPSKLYEAMACARPILLAVDGEARDLVEQQAGAAIHVEPENPLALTNAILALRAQPALAQQLGQRGRAYVEAHFDRDLLVARLDEHIEQALGGAGKAPTRSEEFASVASRE